jgi:gliding motility-associated lipoprotein GldH
MFQRIVLFFSLFSFLIAGCVPSPYYEKHATFPRNEWSNKAIPSFKFDIKDTSVAYNLYFIIRHTEAYPFSNIWIYIYSKQPDAKKYEQSRIEIPLAEPSGKWLGRGMGEIWEQRMPITRNDNPMQFNKPGTYEIKFEQNMRVNPLPEILQVGLRIEKADQPKRH